MIAAFARLEGRANRHSGPPNGRPSQGPTTTMSAPLLLGIEFGGTKLQLGLGHGDGQILSLERRVIEPGKGAEGILAQVKDAFAPLLARVGADRGRVDAAGIGFGGPVNTVRGSVIKSHQVKGWDGFPLADWVRRELGIPEVSVQNDADTAGLGEARFGAGVGYSPVLYATIGSGIGGGLIIDGRIYRGAGAGAMEIGHLRILDSANVESGAQTLESIASGWGIAAAARRVAERQAPKPPEDWAVLAGAGGDPSRITGAMVAEAARRGDPESLAILRRATSSMAIALNHAVTLVAPRRIILGGGVSLIGDELWFDPIRSQLDREIFAPFRGTYDIVQAALGEEVVVHGALALAADAASTGI